MKISSPLSALLLIVSSGAFIIGIENKPALADCNPFGCSQSSVAECNPFGCPKAPMGEKCTPFGCPPSPQPPQQQPPTQNPDGRRPRRDRDNWRSPNGGGNPQAIQQCMNGLLYERQLVCTRESGCSRIPQEGFGGWEYRRVRTQTSENAAVQACQNSR